VEPSRWGSRPAGNAVLPSERTAAPALQLRLDEAIELSTAWLEQQAQAHGIRSLILKGRALSDQGLREPHASSDVDVLIEPGRFEEFLGIMRDAGWTPLRDSFATATFTTHSTTLCRDGWPNSIDIHSEWPGFLRPSDEVFDLLWERRDSLNFAHRAADVPDRSSNLLMLALHSLRGTSAEQRHKSELDGLLGLDLTADERAEIASLASATGATAALRDVLPLLGIDAVVDPADLLTAEYRLWRRKLVQAHSRGRAGLWLLELRRVPWSQKALIMRHGIWPTDRDLLIEHPEVADRFFAKVWARVIRLARGLGQLPRVIPAMRRR
jgi:hypothetical protein